MQKRIETMLGSQLFAIAVLSEELEEAKIKIADLEKRLKDATPPETPEKT